jgi:hypothetical protein
MLLVNYKPVLNRKLLLCHAAINQSKQWVAASQLSKFGSISRMRMQKIRKNFAIPKPYSQTLE